jgi:hypothetical protein
MIPLSVLTAGVIILVLSVYNRGRLRELQYRERIAMIEKGLLPPPETDPARFDAMTATAGPVPARAARYRSGGVLLMGVGVALAVLLSITAGSVEVGVGLGGAIAILGAALFVNGMLTRRDALPPGR